MCQLMVFAGTCTKCAGKHSWDELSKAFLCLEAKNNGALGNCSAGVFTEQHKFDQECDHCAQEDEGVGGVGLYESPQSPEWKRSSARITQPSAKRQRTKTALKEEHTARQS